jgi:hypothetical protein
MALFQCSRSFSKVCLSMALIDEGYHFDRWRKPLLPFPWPTRECGTATRRCRIAARSACGASRIGSQLEFLKKGSRMRTTVETSRSRIGLQKLRWSRGSNRRRRPFQGSPSNLLSGLESVQVIDVTMFRLWALLYILVLDGMFWYPKCVRIVSVPKLVSPRTCGAKSHSQHGHFRIELMTSSMP